MNRNVLRQIGIFVVVAATIVVNILAVRLPLNGLDTAEISDRFAIYFVPAGYVFSIWGLIYSGLIAFAVYQALPGQRENARLRSIAGLVVASGVANITWLFLWHYEVFRFTVVAMLALLVSLIAIYLRLGTGRTRASTAETWAVRVPFSIYLGWITVATIANVSQWLFFLGWNGWGIAPEVWTVIMLAAAVVIAALMAVTRRDVAYLAVLVWAITGIALKQAAVPTVTMAAWAATASVAILMLGSAVSRIRVPSRA